MKYIVIMLLPFIVAQAKVVDLRKYQSSVKEQGDRDTCAYFAVTALIEAAIMKSFDKSVNLSEQFQIHHGKTHFNEHADKEFGATYDILLNFKNQGYSYLESSVPYERSYFSKDRPCEEENPFDPSTPLFCYSQDPLKKLSEKRAAFRGLETESVHGMFTYWQTRSQNIIDHMNKGRSVVITFKVYPPLWSAKRVSYTQEVDEKCESGEYSCYGHAVLLTGYDDEKEVFFFKNSWGEDWGDKGYGEVSFDYVDNFSDEPLTAYFSRYSFFKIRD